MVCLVKTSWHMALHTSLHVKLIILVLEVKIRWRSMVISNRRMQEDSKVIVCSIGRTPSRTRIITRLDIIMAFGISRFGVKSWFFWEVSCLFKTAQGKTALVHSDNRDNTASLRTRRRNNSSNNQGLPLHLFHTIHGSRLMDTTTCVRRRVRLVPNNQSTRNLH